MAANEPRLRVNSARPPGMNPHGLQEPFQPARTLGNPDPGGLGGFFICLKFDHVAAIAQARKAQPEIGILGHIPGIPAADRAQCTGAEMIAGAPEQERQGETRMRPQEEAELDRIFQVPLPGQPGSVAIIGAQGRLERAKLAAG